MAERIAGLAPLFHDVRRGVEVAGFEVQLFLVIALVPDDVEGDHEIVIRITTPSGPSDVQMVAPVQFQGGQEGVHIAAPVNLQPTAESLRQPEFGNYWFDVTIDGRLLTRIPLQVERGSDQEA